MYRRVAIAIKDMEADLDHMSKRRRCLLASSPAQELVLDATGEEAVVDAEVLADDDDDDHNNEVVGEAVATDDADAAVPSAQSPPPPPPADAFGSAPVAYDQDDGGIHVAVAAAVDDLETVPSTASVDLLDLSACVWNSDADDASDSDVAMTTPSELSADDQLDEQEEEEAEEEEASLDVDADVRPLNPRPCLHQQDAGDRAVSESSGSTSGPLLPRAPTLAPSKGLASLPPPPPPPAQDKDDASDALSFVFGPPVSRPSPRLQAMAVDAEAAASPSDIPSAAAAGDDQDDDTLSTGTPSDADSDASAALLSHADLWTPVPPVVPVEQRDVESMVIWTPGPPGNKILSVGWRATRVG